MRTYENLVKRINLVENMYSEVPKHLDYKNAILAYRMKEYVKRSYKILHSNGVKLEEL